MRKSLLHLLVFLSAITSNVFAEVYYSRQNGPWALNTTWSNDRTLQHTGAAAAATPTAGDTVYIGAGHAVDFNPNAGAGNATT
ncbi:MAG TPA: hypothetical protein PKA72_14405, partial [bacterium]|nr:hypothetical protein [bacterium]